MYFTYNGVDSRDLGLYIKDIPFDTLASKRVETLSLPKIDGSVFKEFEAYDSYSISIECILKDSLTIENVKKIKGVFKANIGELVLSTRPDNIYKVRLSSQLNFLEMLERTGSCMLSFEVHPYSELVSGRGEIDVTNSPKLINEGNVPSKPLIKVKGRDTVQIIINDKIMQFEGVYTDFIIDCELEDIYSERGENLNKFMTLDSDFIPLSEGVNTIRHAGASSVKVIPRWREL